MENNSSTESCIMLIYQVRVICNADSISRLRVGIESYHFPNNALIFKAPKYVQKQNRPVILGLDSGMSFERSGRGGKGLELSLVSIAFRILSLMPLHVH